MQAGRTIQKYSGLPMCHEEYVGPDACVRLCFIERVDGVYIHRVRRVRMAQHEKEVGKQTMVCEVVMQQTFFFRWGWGWKEDVVGGEGGKRIV
jgi:hypothetical protein